MGHAGRSLAQVRGVIALGPSRLDPASRHAVRRNHEFAQHPDVFAIQ